MFFSVPYDEGWVAEIDGKRVDFVRADLGFIALVVPEGEHTVTLRYQNASVIPGLICSAFGVACAIVYVLVSNKLRRKNENSAADA